ncbi:hypothetical protein niasHT_030564 [Heterodera trifolii]|uniref:Uncharacterized protein n=1 Tax=Heterodera trifolii TaxID=157864 RepID=A0ABD2IXJ8_9BILA
MGKSFIKSEQSIGNEKEMAQFSLDVQIKKEIKNEVKLERFEEEIKNEQSEQMDEIGGKKPKKDEEETEMEQDRSSSTNSDETAEEFDNDEQKRKLMILKEYDIRRKEWKLKNGIKKENRYKIEAEIAKGLGTNRDKIYQWKRENVPTHQKRSEETKRKTVEKFEKMKIEYKNKWEKEKFEGQIAKEMERKIQKWKREMQNGEIKSAEMAKEFGKRKRALEQKKYNEFEQEIAKKLGTNRGSIYKWKRELEHGNVLQMSSEWLRDPKGGSVQRNGQGIGQGMCRGLGQGFSEGNGKGIGQGKCQGMCQGSGQGNGQGNGQGIGQGDGQGRGKGMLC